MKIHTNHLNYSDLYEAARIARVDLDCNRVGSRSRTGGFEIHLEGESRRRPNGGSRGAGSGYAATWDQWGVFLAVLFDRDPEMLCGSAKYPVYRDRADFQMKTDARFTKIGGGWDDYWPADAHGDHSWDGRSCRKCSALRRVW